MPTIQTRRFSYRLPAWRMALMILMAVGLCVGGAFKAYTNTRGLRVLLIPLSPDQATVFWWGLCVMGVFVLLVCCWQTWLNARSPGYVELGSQAALLPRMRSSELRTVPYNEIEQVRTRKVPGQEMAIIRYSDGESRLMSMGFASSGDFHAFMQGLEQRI